MSKKNLLIIVVILIIIGFFVLVRQVDAPFVVNDIVEVFPVQSTAFVLKIDDKKIFNNPIGFSDYYTNYGSPNLILIGDADESSFTASTLETLDTTKTKFLLPTTVYEKLPEQLKTRAVIMSDGDIHYVDDIRVTAISVNNIENDGVSGNGYLLQSEDIKIYIVGDTTVVPQSEQLFAIDMVFIPIKALSGNSLDFNIETILSFDAKMIYLYNLQSQADENLVSELSQIFKKRGVNIEVILLDK